MPSQTDYLAAVGANPGWRSELLLRSQPGVHRHLVPLLNLLPVRFPTKVFVALKFCFATARAAHPTH